MTTMPTFDQVQAAFAREEAEGAPKAWRRNEVPSRYECITAEWLTDVLCNGTPGAFVESFELTDKDDGSSNRRRIHLRYNAAGEEGGLPATVFCKAAATVGNRLILGCTGTAQNEVDFFNRVRPRFQLEAPVGIHAGFDRNTGAYLVMMEDLGPHATFCDERTNIDFGRASDMMQVLATLHGTFYESPDLGTSAIPYLDWADWWQKMMAVSPDFGSSCDIGFQQAKDVIPARLFARASEIWPHTMASAERHRALPKMTIHCDVHARNWYCTNDNRMGLADWQIISVGHWSRDVAYVLATALTVENRRAWEKQLLDIYLDKLAEFGAARVSLDEAWLNLRQQLFSVLSFWTITLRPAKGMPAMQPERLTLELIRRITTMMDDHDVMSSFG